MAPASLTDTPSQKKYTPSFINQLQTEWNEFMLEISHSTPNEEISPNGVDNIPRKNAQEGSIQSLNKFNNSCGGNIVIPVPLGALKRLFSPSRLTADDVFKTEFFNEITENLHLTNIAFKKLQKLLFPDAESSNEISDFPSPSLPSNFRKSAPPRLFFKKKRKLPNKNEILKAFTGLNDKDENLFQKNLNNTGKNDEILLLKNLINIEGNVDQRVPEQIGADNINKQPIIPHDEASLQNFSNKKSTKPKRKESSLRSSARKNTQNRASESFGISQPKRKLSLKSSARKNTQNRASESAVISQPKRKELSSKSGARKNTPDRALEDSVITQSVKRYSSIYDLQLSDGGDSSSSLFYTTKNHKKNLKPTIVCTYFSQIELTKIYQIVKKLGHFEIENSVSSRTTHLVCGSSNKTINLCKAVARGCWVLEKKWVTVSAKDDRWLFEERFEKTGVCPAIKENRLKRQKYGSQYQCDVFAGRGSMYVSKLCSQPSVDDIKELILLGGGRLTDKPEQASYVIGSMPKRNYIKEIWILNCILQGSLLDVSKYTKSK